MSAATLKRLALVALVALMLVFIAWAGIEVWSLRHLFDPQRLPDYRP